MAKHIYEIVDRNDCWKYSSARSIRHARDMYKRYYGSDTNTKVIRKTQYWYERWGGNPPCLCMGYK